MAAITIFRWAIMNSDVRDVLLKKVEVCADNGVERADVQQLASVHPSSSHSP